MIAEAGAPQVVTEERSKTMAQPRNDAPESRGASNQIQETDQRPQSGIQWYRDISQRNLDFVKKEMARWLPNGTQQLAYSLWELQCRPIDAAFDTWLQAENYFENQRTGLVKTVSWPLGNEEALSAVLGMFSSKDYFDKIRALASLMWEYAGRPFFRPMDFVLAAEKHGFAIMAHAVRMAVPAGQARVSLTKALEELDPAAHLERIRQAAYYISEDHSKRHQDSLADWLQAESEVLEGLAKGEGADRTDKA